MRLGQRNRRLWCLHHDSAWVLRGQWVIFLWPEVRVSRRDLNRDHRDCFPSNVCFNRPRTLPNLEKRSVSVSVSGGRKRHPKVRQQVKDIDVFDGCPHIAPSPQTDVLCVQRERETEKDTVDGEVRQRKIYHKFGW